MRQSPNAISLAEAAISRINTEYLRLLEENTNYSLLTLFNSERFDFADYCKDFSPHPKIRQLKQVTLQFGEQYGILLPNAEHYVTCAMFLFPQATLDKILLLSKNYAVDFYLNDTMGREAKPTTEEKQRLYEIRDRLAALGDSLAAVGDISLAEKANIEVLSEMSKTTPIAWFNGFLRLYLYHIEVAHKSYDAASLGYVQAIEEYIDMRCYISGMPHTVSLIEYANGVYLNWDVLKASGVAEDIQKINWTVSLVGALTNDLFSFEKEVIDHKTDSNLVVLIALNNFRMGLKESIQIAGSIIRNLLSDYQVLLERIRKNASELSAGDMADLDVYLTGLKYVLQACWMWQANTKRYKRRDSIWQETSIQAPVTA